MIKEEVQEAPVIEASLGGSKPKFQFSIEEVEKSDDEENQLTAQEFEEFIQQNISTPEEGEAVTEVLQQIALNLPQSIFVANNEPAENDLEESASALLPRKRKRRDPMPGVLITDQVQETSTPIEPNYVAQDIQSPITESILMDQDDQSPICEESQ